MSPKMDILKGFISMEDGMDYGLCFRKARGRWLFEPSDELAALLRDVEAAVQRKVEQCVRVNDLALEIAELAERAWRSRAKKQKRARDGSFYERLVAEIEDETLDVVGVSESLDTVTLRARDVAGREFLVRVELPPAYPQEAPVCFTELPEALNLEWDGHDCGLTTVQEQFEDAIRVYEAFFDVLDEIDAKTWVLDPAVTRALCSRRIVIKPHCYVQVTIDPLAPRRLPRVQFLGADALVSPLLAKLNERANMWNSNKGVIANLEQCLQVSFPQRPSDTGEEMQANACGICYEFHSDDDSVPDIVCSNERCQKSFHRKCLYDWLRSIPSTKQNFSTLFGECPFCSNAISFSTRGVIR